MDRTMQELEYDDEFEFEEDEFEEDEFEYEDDEFEFEFEDEFEYETGGSPFTEEEEMELASELLAIGSEEELDQFLGKLVKKAWRGVKRFGKSKVWRGIKKGLGKVAKVALPIAGRVAGSFFGGPIGGKIGGKLGSWVSNLFEMELEGMSPEDQEFEIARRFIRLAGTAAINASKAPSSAPVNRVVSTAIKKAAKTHAPGITRGRSKRLMSPSSRRGSWKIVGKKVVLYGLPLR